MEVVGGNNWSYKSCKDPVKSSTPTNIATPYYYYYRLDAIPIAQPTVPKH